MKRCGPSPSGGPPRVFGEQGYKAIYFKGTGEQMPFFQGTGEQAVKFGELGNTKFYVQMI